MLVGVDAEEKQGFPFLSLLYSKPLREYSTSNFEFGYEVRMSRSDSQSRNGYRPQLTQEGFKKCRKYFQNTPNIQNKGGIRREYTSYSLSKRGDRSQLTMEAFRVKLVQNAVEQMFIDKTQLFYKLFSEATESGGPPGGCTFGNMLSINVTKCYSGRIQVFWEKTFKFARSFLTATHSLTFH